MEKRIKPLYRGNTCCVMDGFNMGLSRLFTLQKGIEKFMRQIMKFTRTFSLKVLKTESFC